jgi:hypothetical protein
MPEGHAIRAKRQRALAVRHEMQHRKPAVHGKAADAHAFSTFVCRLHGFMESAATQAQFSMSCIRAEPALRSAGCGRPKRAGGGGN